MVAKVGPNSSYWIASLKNKVQKHAQADPDTTQNKIGRLDRQLQGYILMIDLDTFKLHNKTNYLTVWLLIYVFLIYANV